MDREPSSDRAFYVTGGTMQRDAPSYVVRQADRDLLDGLMAREFCYVLTARQMGKSSLMVRAAARLRERGRTVVVIDLTAIGQNLTSEQWYEGLLSRIGRELGIEDDLEDFWLENERIPALHRWSRAMREVVLEHSEGDLVIFVDEIDVVLSLPFATDEFFAAIREFYNRRGEDSELNRLTFCLLGVAAPAELIADKRRTPFNIGRRVELSDFTKEEAQPLSGGIRREGAGGLLAQVLYWTGGHPYLTQRLCLAVAQDDTVASLDDVDRLCADLFFSHRALERDDNLLFVRERLLRGDGPATDVLGAYGRVLAGEDVRDDERDPAANALTLAGIAKVVDGYLAPRNHIYERVFDRDWVAKQGVFVAAPVEPGADPGSWRPDGASVRPGGPAAEPDRSRPRRLPARLLHWVLARPRWWRLCAVAAILIAVGLVAARLVLTPATVVVNAASGGQRVVAQVRDANGLLGETPCVLECEAGKLLDLTIEYEGVPKPFQFVAQRGRHGYCVEFPSVTLEFVAYDTRGQTVPDVVLTAAELVSVRIPARLTRPIGAEEFVYCESVNPLYDGQGRIEAVRWQDNASYEVWLRDSLRQALLLRDGQYDTPRWREIVGYLLKQSGEVSRQYPLIFAAPGATQIAPSGSSGPPSDTEEDQPIPWAITSTRQLTKADVEGKSPAALRLARNEILARHGYAFHEPALSAYFRQFYWYRPTSNDITLTEVESYNAEFLKAHEDRARR